MRAIKISEMLGAWTGALLVNGLVPLVLLAILNWLIGYGFMVGNFGIGLFVGVTAERFFEIYREYNKARCSLAGSPPKG